MRFFKNSPSIPDILLDRRDAGRVVFLCGAGVSFNSGMPDFFGLTKHVVETFDPPSSSLIMVEFSPWLEGQKSSAISLDQIFNLLQQEYGRDEVNRLVAERLAEPIALTEPSKEHGIVRRISSDMRGNPQIVTTNFDTLFETGHHGVIKHVPPALPNLSLGIPITGISYLHGRLPDKSTYQYPFVLSSADFGRAYLAEGWATQFVRDLLAEYTVVLVGYQAEDPPLKYLLQGLNHDGRSDRTNLYAFDCGIPEQIEAKWRDRGVTPIAYPEHDVLWEALEAWAQRADDPRRWRDDVIVKTGSDPKTLQPFERGQVAHLLRTTAGAKSFQSASPKPHPEWICILDAGSRAANPSSGYGDDAETFDPLEQYGLDDDPERPKETERLTHRVHENLLEWNRNDSNPSTAHRLGGRQVDGREDIPSRLFYFSNWIGKSLDSPAMAWWAARQNGLHLRVLGTIRWHLRDNTTLHRRARTVWNLIVEHQSDPRQRSRNEGWYDLKDRISKEGWTTSVRREFAATTKPMIRCSIPAGLSASRPPQSKWEDVELCEITNFEVSFPEGHGEELDVPNEALLSVLNALQQGLVETSGILAEIGRRNFQVPTCYPARDVDGDDQHLRFYHDVRLFISLFDRLTAYEPTAAAALSRTWPTDDKFFFRNFCFYAANQPELFDIEDAYHLVEKVDARSFWREEWQRELMFLIADRWGEFSEEQQVEVSTRILAGFENPGDLSDEEFSALMLRMILQRGRWLQAQGCTWPNEQAKQLDELARSMPDWSDDWAVGVTTLHGIKSFRVATDDNPATLADLPVSEIIDAAANDLHRGFDDVRTEKRPFTGLVKANPRKAIAALTAKSMLGQFTATFWSSLIRDWPDDTSASLTKLMLRSIARLPHSFLRELGNTIGDWLSNKLPEYLELDRDLAWEVFDQCTTALISDPTGAATERAIGETRIGGEIINPSRRTYGRAINGPIGKLTVGVVNSLVNSKPEEGSFIPLEYKNRLDRLIASPGEGSDHAVAILALDIPWFDRIDPEWTSSRLLPLLVFEHTAAEAAWNGFLSRSEIPNPKILAIIKSLLLDLFPRIYDFGWERDLAKVAANWLGWMAVFGRDEKDSLTTSEARDVLRNMTNETRQNVIFWLGQVGKANENGWSELVAPFIKEVWPREKAFRTSSSVTSWIGLLVDTGESFKEVYEAVKLHLVPIEGESHWLYRFTREFGGERPITSDHPIEVLDMLDTIIPNSAESPPYELRLMLNLVADSDDSLVGDPRFIRLLDLTEKT
jgi:hypothetical protein